MYGLPYYYPSRPGSRVAESEMTWLFEQDLFSQN